MNRVTRADIVCGLVESIKTSVTKYEKAEKEGNTCCGYGTIGNEDSRTSIARRCMVAREELLQIMKSLEG